MTARSAVALDQGGAGTTITPYTPGSSDSFSINDLPATLRVSNGSVSSINVTFVDGGKTPLGTSAASLTPAAVAAGAVRSFKLVASMCDSGGNITANFSATASVSCELTK
jgi:hypothetical protein